MFVILATCRVIGWIGRRYLKQPQVVGEMIAGVILGPSLFGLFLPEIRKRSSPPTPRVCWYVGAQLGVGLYMFLVGLGFRSRSFPEQPEQGGSGLDLRHGGAASDCCHRHALAHDRAWFLFSESATRFDATLFMGAAIAITAFPMLARIDSRARPEPHVTGHTVALCRSDR